MGWVKLQDINFLALQSAVFCVQCELISENNTPACLACGSQAVVSLSRVLGGSLRGQQTANVIADAELNRLVRDLLRTVSESCAASGNGVPASFAGLAPSRHHIRATGTSRALPGASACGPNSEIHPAEIDLEPAISMIAERAQALTGATGAAIALRKGNEIVCRARTGRTAPDLGVRLQTDSGISADCVRTGKLCFATTLIETRVSISRVAAGSEYVPSSRLRCAISDGRSVCSKSSLRHRTPLMAETLPPCRCSPA